MPKLSAYQIAAQVESQLLTQWSTPDGLLARIKAAVPARILLPSQIVADAANAAASSAEAAAVDRSQGAIVATKRILAARKNEILAALAGTWPAAVENVNRLADSQATPTPEPEGPGLLDLLPNPGDLADGVGNALADLRKTAVTVAIAILLIAAAAIILPKLKAEKP